MKTTYERHDVIPLLAEVFREFGFEGTTLNRIADRTGLGRGSLYHFFPGGKDEMAAAVLNHIDTWFEQAVFVPLRTREPEEALSEMWINIDQYFHSGRRICLVGCFALDQTRDRFARDIASYFTRWIDALSMALERMGEEQSSAGLKAEAIVCSIQGALVLARATQDPSRFSRILSTLRKETFLRSATRLSAG